MTTTTKVGSGKTIRPPIKRFGGKYYLAKRIVSLMPRHRNYIEPFAGGLSVLLNKPRVEHEFAGDLDSELMNFWSVLRDRTTEFVMAVSQIEYSESRFDNASKFADASGESIDRAIAYLVRNRFSRGGLGKTFAWSERLRGGKPGDANAWDTIRKELPAIADRVGGVAFCPVGARALIQKFDARETLHYLDPPYLHETRTATKAYEHEMSRDDHAELLALVRQCKGAVMISGYDNPMYTEALEDWSRVQWELPNNSGQGKTKQRRVECLWMNRPINQETTP